MQGKETKIACFSVTDHYDLVVIGGGSGGLACSKEGQLRRDTFLLVISDYLRNSLLISFNVKQWTN